MVMTAVCLESWGQRWRRRYDQKLAGVKTRQGIGAELNRGSRHMKSLLTHHERNRL